MTLIAPAEKDRPRESGAFAWIVVIALGLMSAGTTGTYMHHCRLIHRSCM